MVPIPGLGTEVRDRVSGFAGIATSMSEKLSGTIQIGVQPKTGEKGEMPEAYAIDYQILEVVGEGVSKNIPPVDNAVTVALGDEVIDTVSGYKGITVEKATFVNGCVHFGVQSKVVKDNKCPEPLYFDHKRLKVVKAGAAQKAAQPAEGKAPPGGPNRRAPRP